MDIAKPAIQVLAHAKLKGAQIGAAAGIACVAPRALYLQTPPALGGAACMAGFGMLVGTTTTGLVCVVKLARSDKAGIIDRAERLCENVEQQKIDKACMTAAAAGAVYALKRIGEMADSTNATFGSTLASRRGAWTVVSYVSLGLGAVFGTVVLQKVSAFAVRKIKESRAEDGGSVPSTAPTAPTAEEKEEMLAAATNGATDVVEGATETAGKAVEGATEEVEKMAGEVADEK